MTESFFYEVQVQFVNNGIATRNLDRINIVPAILIQRIVNHRVTKHESDLALAHAGLEFVDHGLGDDIALLDRNAVHARKAE